MGLELCWPLYPRPPVHVLLPGQRSQSPLWCASQSPWPSSGHSLSLMPCSTLPRFCLVFFTNSQCREQEEAGPWHPRLIPPHPHSSPPCLNIHRETGMPRAEYRPSSVAYVPQFPHLQNRGSSHRNGPSHRATWRLDQCVLTKPKHRALITVPI
jgi:hypothetical protein